MLHGGNVGGGDGKFSGGGHFKHGVVIALQIDVFQPDAVLAGDGLPGLQRKGALQVVGIGEGEGKGEIRKFLQADLAPAGEIALADPRVHIRLGDEKRGFDPRPVNAEILTELYALVQRDHRHVDLSRDEAANQLVRRVFMHTHLCGGILHQKAGDDLLLVDAAEPGL